MADEVGMDLAEVVRRAVQANAKFYKGWVDLSFEYLRGISEIFSGEEAAPAEPEVEPGGGVLVLEGEEGAAARGAFLVTNDLGRTVTCELVASPFVDSRGSSVEAQPTFDPAKLDLAPGEQRVVRTAIPIHGDLAPGVAYTGEFAIKGMDGFSVPVVLRRRHRIEDSPAMGDQPAGERDVHAADSRPHTSGRRTAGTARSRAEPARQRQKGSVPVVESAPGRKSAAQKERPQQTGDAKRLARLKE